MTQTSFPTLQHDKVQSERAKAAAKREAEAANNYLHPNYRPNRPRSIEYRDPISLLPTHSSPQQVPCSSSRPRLHPLIISEKGWVNARVEDIAKEWILKLYPRDLDRTVVQDIYVAGRSVLDYGDVEVPRVVENLFRGGIEVKIKKDEDSHTSDSGLSTFQPEGELTMCGSYTKDGIDNND